MQIIYYDIKYSNLMLIIYSQLYGFKDSYIILIIIWFQRPEKKLDGNYTRMLQAILNKFWRQYPTKHQLYGHLPPTKKGIQVRRTRHAGHCWKSRDELISVVLPWTLTYGRAKAGQLARTYIQQLCEDTGCSPEDLPEAMNDREKWRERVRDIRAGDMMMMMMIKSYTQLYGIIWYDIKYSYLILIILSQLYGLKQISVFNNIHLLALLYSVNN